MLHILSGHAADLCHHQTVQGRVQSSACNQGNPRNPVSTWASKRDSILFASARSQFPCAVLGVRDTAFDCDVHVHAMHQLLVCALLTGGVGRVTELDSPDRKFAEDRGASPGSKNSLVKNAPLAVWATVLVPVSCQCAGARGHDAAPLT